VTIGAALLMAAALLPAPAVPRLQGAVLVDGQPAAGAVVILQGPTCCRTVTAADGGFALDPVAPGAYAVAVVWPGRLDRQYADPTTSGLTAVIRRGDRQLPLIRLTTGAAALVHR